MKFLLAVLLMGFSVFAQDPTIPPAKWSISAGNLPKGLTLTEAGLITGKPLESGTFTFTVKVVYQTQTKEKQITLVVNAATGAILDITSPDILPAAALGGEYAYQLTFRFSI